MRKNKLKILILLISLFVICSLSACKSEKESETSKSLKCTLTISCEEILNNLDKKDPSKEIEYPEDGFILKEKEVSFEEGDSAFDILLDAVTEEKIHMEFSKTPGTNSAYIEGIANIYEMDFGQYSGWGFMVNGEYPVNASSEYEVSEGDLIEFIYICSF